MATAANFASGSNAQQANKLVLYGKHITIEDLKLIDDVKKKQIYTNYLVKQNIPRYPTPVEFHITHVTHVTNKDDLPGILASNGFKGLDENSFSWWTLKITEAEIAAAEERFLEILFPNSSTEQRAAQEPFLRDFTTSPLFSKASRFGNFRFTFPMTELMEAFKVEMCDGEEPVLRVYGTKLFKQEIEYVVLVHSPQFNEKFKAFPELASSPLVAYDGNQIIWKAQAICDKYKKQMVLKRNKVETECVNSELYVWDQVGLAFHVNGVLKIPQTKLKKNLCCCKIDSNVNIAQLRNKGSFPSIAEAKQFLKSLPAY